MVKSRNLYYAKAASRGFTLIELMITAGMFLVVGLAVYFSLSNGVKVYKRVHVAAPQEDIYIFFDKITADLSNCLYHSRIKFVGERDSIQFATLVDLQIQDSGAQKTLGRISYTLDSYNEILLRRQDSYSQVYEDDEGPSKKMADSVKSFELSYYCWDQVNLQYEWKGTWGVDMDEEATTILPLAVRIVVVFGDSSNPSRLTRTITLYAGG